MVPAMLRKTTAAAYHNRVSLSAIGVFSLARRARPATLSPRFPPVMAFDQGRSASGTADLLCLAFRPCATIHVSWRET
jgi:hypothetical protein